MTAAEQRIASGDLVKRATYRHQRWLAIWRAYGGTSDDPHARYIRGQLREIRRALAR